MTKDLTTKIAHTAQIIVASAACVADPSGLTLAAAGSTGALSLPEVIKRNTDAHYALTKPIAKALKKSLKAPTFHMPENGPVLLPQMLDGARLTPDDLTGCGLDPDLILGRLLNRHVDPEHRSGEMAEAFCNWLRPPLTKLLGDQEFIKTLAPKIWATALSDLRHIRETTDRLEQQFRDTAEELGITKGLVIGLARRIAADVSDFETALRELDRALNIVANMEKRSLTHSNTDDLVDQVMRQMAELNEANDLDGAAKVADDALADWREEQQRQQATGLRLLEAALEQHILRRDAPAIAGRLIERMQMEQPDTGQHFALLRQIQDDWYVKGRDKGLALELEVAIELAKRCCSIAKGDEQIGAAQNVLGTALCALGERESGTERLEQAVVAYRDALKEWTWEKVPLQWATTQNNLGNALQTLGQRESGTERLDQAVAAYRDALKEWTREKVPLDWAMTQNNLGTALQTLGQRESGTERLEQAVEAYRDALKEFSREKVPLQWAAPQRNLGGVYLAFFDKSGDVAHLDKAEAHLREALEVFEVSAPYYAGMAREQLQQIAERRGGL